MSTVLREPEAARKGVFVEAELAQALGLHFPPAKEALANTPYQQIVKIREEIREFHAAAPGSFEKLMEAWDVIAAVEGYLARLALDGVDVGAAKAAVFTKNAERGYYLYDSI